MCGIWGIVGNPNIKETYEELLRQLEARGPEFTKLLNISGELTLGFTRLAINGLTPEGNQPFIKDDIYVICNGEIYNYQELAKRWDIDLPVGTSDCAVIAGLVSKLGMTELCRTLDGVFAMIIVDTRNQIMYVARDPYGVRPLFQGTFPTGEVMWASEIKGISKSCENVQAFPPGTWRSYTLKGILLQEYKYHSVPHVKIPCFNSATGRSYAKFALNEALTKAVKKRLLSDRPIGALLSGGLDSSLVCAIAAKELAKNGQKLNTFSIGMPGSTDLSYAKQVADYIGSVHHEIVVKPEDFLNAIPQVIKAIESYDITSVRASVGNWLIGKYIKENTDIKVVFNGDGSDEIGGGYLYFYKAPSDEEFEAESERLLEEIHLFDVLRSDRSMASHGLEARTPFLDKSVVETWRSFGTDLRRPTAGIDGRGARIEKQILREAFDDKTLPYEVLSRKKEAFSDGVSSVTDSWYLRCAAYAKQEFKMENAKEKFPHNTPLTEEAYWYRTLFVEYYGAERASIIPHMWLPKWVKNGSDPSARTLTEVYTTSKGPPLEPPPKGK